MRWPDGLWYGGDYNPEQWPDAVGAEDVALMKRAGVNLVSVGVFAWSRLEPHEGRYEFRWLDRVLDRLAAAGIGVALATPTASPPPWFSSTYPDALPVTATGTRLLHGSRDTYCAAAPAYRAAARGIAAALAERYADHPALALWHVHNEYGTTCYCFHAAGRFREWLRERYGDLDTLNDAWVTSFWGQHYSAWPQIHPPRATQYMSNPAHVLDFKRFWSDELLAAFVEQRDVLRGATPDVPVTTNFALGDWVPVDYARWASEVDLVAIDHYPSGTGAAADEQTALAADTARGWARGRPWLLMETAANLIYSEGRMRTRPPGQLLRHSLTHVARGSRGAMFFQWRAPRGGAEMYHAAMVPHAGADSRVFAEVVELGSVLRRLAVSDAPVEATVAVLWDAQSAWALTHPGLPAPDLDHTGRVAEVHAALGRLGHTVDVVPVDAPLAGYRAVFVPGVYIASADLADAVRSYVDGGGTVVVSYFSGIVDETLRVWPGAYPGAFRDVLGLRVTEVDPLPPGATVELSTGDIASAWTEVVEPLGAKVVATYPDGRPAITRNRFHAGTAWYVASRLDPAALTRVISQFLGDDGPHEAETVDLSPSEAKGGLDLVRRGALLFAINNSTVDRSVDDVTVPAGGVKVIETGS